MMKKYLFLFLFLFSYTIANACFCFPVATFCESISDENDDILQSLNVFHGKIIFQNEEHMLVSVIEVLHGSPDLRLANIVSGDGGNCGMPTSFFNLNDQFIFATSIFGDNKHNLSSCGTTFLKVEGNLAVGLVAPGIESSRIDQLVDNLGCSSLNLTVNFKIFPNPSLNNAFLNLELKEEADIEVTLFNVAGQRMFKKKWTAVSELTEEFPSKDYPSGVYIVQLKAFGTKFYRKMIKS